MAVTVSDVKNRLPEFCTVDNSIVALVLQAAEDCVNRVQWGEKRADQGVIFLVGHLLKLHADGSGLAGGPVSSESEGAISVSYAVSAAYSESAYGATVYGRHYLELRRTTFPERFSL